MDNVFQLQPNTFGMEMNAHQCSVSMSTQPPELPTPVELAAKLSQLQGSTLPEASPKSHSSSMNSTTRSLPGQLTQASQQQLMVNEAMASTEEPWMINNTILESVLVDQTDGTHSAKASIYQSMDSHNSCKDVTDVSQLTPQSWTGPVVDTHTEIKRMGTVETVVPVREEVKDVYVSKCKAIVRRDVALNQSNQGLRLVPRVRNEYIENLCFVCYCLFGRSEETVSSMSVIKRQKRKRVLYSMRVRKKQRTLLAIVHLPSSVLPDEKESQHPQQSSWFVLLSSAPLSSQLALLPFPDS